MHLSQLRIECLARILTFITYTLYRLQIVLTKGTYLVSVLRPFLIDFACINITRKDTLEKDVFVITGVNRS